MSKLKTVIEVLGEENTDRLRSSIVDIILDNIKRDFDGYECYLLYPDDIIEFIESCKKEAFDSVKEDIINDMMKKIKESI